MSSLPKWLEEKRDEFALDHVHGIGPKSNQSYRSGFNACAEILLPEMKLLVDALAQIAQEGKWSVEREETELRSPEQILARRALARHRERFELDQSSEKANINERSPK